MGSSTDRQPPASPDASQALLVVDRADAAPPRLRATAPGEVRCSASAQFSADGWKEIRRRLGDPEPLYLVDLRQESHAFLNGVAVSWYASNNWGCVGLGDDEADALERLRIRLLACSDTVLVGRAEDVKKERPPTLEVWRAELVQHEAEVADLPPGRYVRLRVTDHMRPRDEIVDRFVDLVRELPDRAHVHFHCRGGRGRATLFMALLDLLRGGADLPLPAIVERHRVLSSYDLLAEVDPSRPKAPYIAERARFVADFHRYARANPGGRPLGFTEWRARCGP